MFFNTLCHPSRSVSRKEVIPLKKLAIGIGAWVVLLTAAHFTMNVNWGVLLNDRLPESKRKLNVAYIPVT